MPPRPGSSCTVEQPPGRGPGPGRTSGPRPGHPRTQHGPATSPTTTAAEVRVDALAHRQPLVLRLDRLPLLVSRAQLRTAQRGAPTARPCRPQLVTDQVAAHAPTSAPARPTGTPADPVGC